MSTKKGTYINIKRYQRYNYPVLVDDTILDTNVSIVKNPDDYINRGIDVYVNTRKKGKTSGVLEYGVDATHYVKPAKKTVVEYNASKIQTLKQQGMSDTDILMVLAGIK